MGRRFSSEPIMMLSDALQKESLQLQVIRTRSKINQREIILEKFNGVVCNYSPYKRGIRPRDLSMLTGFPEPTVRKFLKEFVMLKIAKVRIISGNHSIYKPVKTKSVITNIVK